MAASTAAVYLGSISCLNMHAKILMFAKENGPCILLPVMTSSGACQQAAVLGLPALDRPVVGLLHGVMLVCKCLCRHESLERTPQIAYIPATARHQMTRYPPDPDCLSKWEAALACSAFYLNGEGIPQDPLCPSNKRWLPNIAA